MTKDIIKRMRDIQALQMYNLTQRQVLNLLDSEIFTISDIICLIKTFKQKKLY